jgi:hypothetical protein
LTAALALLAVAAAAMTAGEPSAPVDPAKADAALRTFEAQLESHDSATVVLQAWCDAHGPPGAKIAARQSPGADEPPPPAARAALRLGPGVQVRYRRVDLVCGDRVLSHADNWYLPGQLTPQMNQALGTTRTPFGVVVKPLHFTRRNLQTQLLVPSPPPAVLPAEVLRHAAVLSTGEGAPFSYVIETYTDQVAAY